MLFLVPVSATRGRDGLSEEVACWGQKLNRDVIKCGRGQWATGTFILVAEVGVGGGVLSFAHSFIHSWEWQSIRGEGGKHEPRLAHFRPIYYRYYIHPYLRV